MLLIISGTNRPGSRTEKLARYCFEQLVERNIDVHFLSLVDLPLGVIHSEMYKKAHQIPALSKIQDELVVPATKFLFVIPEYNGGVPGVLKTFIDGLSVRKYDASFKNKKACLIGVSSGRAGNLRGLDYFTNVLNYVKMHVFRLKLPVSSIDDHLDGKGKLDHETSREINKLLDDFLEW